MSPEVELTGVRKTEVFRESIIAKLQSIGRGDLAKPLGTCETEETYLTCKECGTCKTVWNRCNNRWCPTCGPRRTRKRADELAVWTRTLKQPKHLTLTNRNTGILTGFAVGTQLRGLAAIRRRRFAAGWQSGSWTLEVTNEGRGWHLHVHSLIEANWVDMPEVARAWARYTGQDDNAIICVKDCRSGEYLKEVSKYVCKCSEMSSWTPQEIAMCMDSFRGRRAFGVFGRAFGERREWQKAIAEQRHERSKCECGACNWKVETEQMAEYGHVLRPRNRRR